MISQDTRDRQMAQGIERDETMGASWLQIKYL
jgi:hypothetical protein